MTALQLSAFRSCKKHPTDILALGVEGICQIWREAKVRAAGINRAKKLVAAAERSIGRKGCEAVRQELWQLMEEHDLLSRQLNDMMHIIPDLLGRITGADMLLNVPGAGVVTVAGFLSEVGDISRICCIIKVPKVAEPKWRTLHLQFGECCSGIA